MEKKRIVWIDILKAIAFYFVILGHMNISAGIKNWIYSFHMPLFFLASGFTLNIAKTYSSSFKDHFSKLFKRMVVPYFWIEFICLCFAYLVNVVVKNRPLPIKDNIIGIFVGNGLIMPNPSRPLYFALVLFLAQVLLWVVIKLSKKNYLAMAVILSALCVFSLSTQKQPMPWRINVVPVAMLLIFIGRLLGDLYAKYSEKLFGLGMVKYLAICLALFALGFVIYKFNGRPSMAGNAYGKQFVCFVLSAVLTSVGFALVTMKLPENELLVFIGQNTFFYMGFHKPLILLCESLFPGKQHSAIFIISVSAMIFLLLAPVVSLIQRFAPFLAAKPVRKDDVYTTIGKFVSIFAAFIIPYKYAFAKLFSGFLSSALVANALMLVSFAVVCVGIYFIFQKVFPFAFIQEKKKKLN